MHNLEKHLACAELKTSHLHYLVSNTQHRVENLLLKVETLYERLKSQ